MNALRYGLMFVLSLVFLGANSLWAGPGHDHGDSSPTVTGPASPRFTATSDDFELVGVLNGHQLSLYLDHAPDNRPVEGATLELQVGNQSLAVTPVGPGEFSAEWESEAQSGEFAITALITAGSQSDILVADLDLHAEAESDTHAGAAPFALWPWVMGGAALLLGGAGWANARRTRRVRSQRQGASA